MSTLDEEALQNFKLSFVRKFIYALGMDFLRIFMPSWRFFDRLGRVPEVFFRGKSLEAESKKWQPLLEKPKRKSYNLFFNPGGNLYLAQVSLIEQVLDDSQKESKKFEETVSFKLLKNLVREKVLESSPDYTHYDFKIIVREYDGAKVKETEVFVTPEYSVR